MKKKRPPGLIAIVIYKGFVALLLAATSIILLLALKNHEALAPQGGSQKSKGKNISYWLSWY